MAQLSVFDKLRHHSDKDFTCSIGKADRIYITFRHETWKRFTSTDYISVYIGNAGALKFGDPKNTKMLAPCFKLQQNKEGNEETKATTRYLQIEGKKYPAILDVVRRCAGSYDFPEVTADPKVNKVVATTTIDKPINKDIRERFEQMVIKPQVKAYTEEEARADAFTARRNQFMEDLDKLMQKAQSPEERTAIVEALGKLYDMRPQQTIQIPTETEEQRDAWSI